MGESGEALRLVPAADKTLSAPQLLVSVVQAPAIDSSVGASKRNCQTRSADMHTSAAVCFSVKNNLVLNIATDASLKQARKQEPEGAADPSIVCSTDPATEIVYEHGRVVWTGSTVWAAAVPLARHLTSLEQDWTRTTVCELGYVDDPHLTAELVGADGILRRCCRYLSQLN